MAWEDWTGKAAAELLMENKRLRAENERLRKMLEPGTAPSLVDGMFREAQRLGHNPVSSKHALSFLVEEIERLREALSKVDAYVTTIAVPRPDWLIEIVREALDEQRA